MFVSWHLWSLLFFSRQISLYVHGHPFFLLKRLWMTLINSSHALLGTILSFFWRRFFVINKKALSFIFRIIITASLWPFLLCNDVRKLLFGVKQRFFRYVDLYPKWNNWFYNHLHALGFGALQVEVMVKEVKKDMAIKETPGATYDFLRMSNQRDWCSCV